jgi:hypothetical protein
MTFGIAMLVAMPAVRSMRSEEIPVKYREGTTHAFLILRSTNKTDIGSGELTELPAGDDRVSVKFTLHFKDGSIYEESSTFSQGGTLRLLTYHLLEKGPTFPQAQDVSIDPPKGNVTVGYIGTDGARKTIEKHMNIPPDVANGIVPFVVRNISPAKSANVSIVATTPKPRLVRLSIAPAGEDAFASGDGKQEATRFVIKVQVGGVAGVAANAFGKVPPDSYVWMSRGGVPTFMKSQQFLTDGPVCVVELAAPRGENSSK